MGISIRSVLFFLIVFFNHSLLAHDIGLSKTELIELETNQYILKVKKAVGFTDYQEPVFSNGIEVLEFKNLNLIGGWYVFKFRTKNNFTREDTLYLDWSRNGVMLKVAWENGDEESKIIERKNGMITIPLGDFRAGSASLTASAKFYFILGIEHILTGWDHLLFVFTLLFLIKGIRSLFLTITTFTVAHSITLGFATLGYVNMPSAPVEIVIALSIVLICIEVLNATKGQLSLTHQYPWIIAFTFGLIHGFGFAGALSEIGIPSNEVPMSLLFFNVGIEFGQIMFVIIILAIQKLSTFFPLSLKHQLVINRVFIYLAGITAMYWGIERIYQSFLL